MVDNESVEKIVDKIREDGEAEIRSILDKAERTAADIVDKAEKKASVASEGILKEAREKGETTSRRLLSSVSIEVKRAKLKRREDIINIIRASVEKELEKAREREDYPSILAALIVEAIEALEGDSFEVYVDNRDIAILKDKVFKDVKQRLSAAGREAGSIVALPLEKSSLGGARVGIPGGKVIFDNTFEARLYRMRDRIRNLIFEEVFEPEGSEEPGSA